MFIDYHPNGKKANKGFYIKGKKTGVWSKWDAKGKLYYKVDFSNNQQKIIVGGK
jgi:antitoxin component YwqK of YwqJK toxin-antitoxin module